MPSYKTARGNQFLSESSGWGAGRVKPSARSLSRPSPSANLVGNNEAFSGQILACIRELGLDESKLNVNGGAVALGHPIGASGAGILTTLLYALRARGEKRGVATLCLGGGNGVALAVELV